MTEMRPWIVAQLGAREHYVIPRELHRQNRLRALLTDAWIPSDSWLRQLPSERFQSLLDRFHPDLRDASILSFTASLVKYELEARVRGWTGWTRMIRRNRWFERELIRAVRREDLLDGEPPPFVFAYSYAAHDLFVEAKKKGAICVLGQIDAGPHEEDIVATERKRYPRYQESQVRAPASYWERWQHECELADVIVVNSNWSKRALAKAGVEGDHVKVVPLAYVPPDEDPHPSYPAHFTNTRPLQVLYLGTLTLRKGLARLLAAAQKLEEEPIEFWIVGDGSVAIPEEMRALSNVTWIGRVPRSEVVSYYRTADVFLFPTLSDGFGLTQLEALGMGLPVIASRRCGEVVTHERTGLILEGLEATDIVEMLRWCRAHPSELASYAQAAPAALEAYRPEVVVNELQEVAALSGRQKKIDAH